MTIVIKEIKVITTIERNVRQPAADEARLQRLRNEIMREVKQTLRREKNIKEER